MPYNPGIQDISGQLYAQGMERGQQYLNKGINQFFRTQEEETAFEAKNKAMLAMITANKEQFGLKDDESLKQFLKGSTFESQRDKYARMGTLVETNVMMANQKRAEANAQSENILKTAQAAQANAHARVFGEQAKALENPAPDESMSEAQFQDSLKSNLGVPAENMERLLCFQIRILKTELITCKIEALLMIMPEKQKHTWYYSVTKRNSFYTTSVTHKITV